MRLGVIGWPLGQTLSPAMHNAGLTACGLSDWRYDAIPVSPEQFSARWRELVHPSSDLRGFNITLPFKRVALAHCSRIDAVARAVGAINTVAMDDRNERREVVGYNTDVAGVCATLIEAGVETAGGAALVLGAGGAARAVVAALIQLGLRKISVAARRLERAVAMMRDLEPQVSVLQPADSLVRPELAALALGDEQELRRALSQSQLICNATTVGMLNAGASVVRPESLADGAALLDCVYHPAEQTALVAAARARGLLVADGLTLLLHQGARSFELWTGVSPPLTAMRRALERARAARRDAERRSR